MGSRSAAFIHSADIVTVTVCAPPVIADRMAAGLVGTPGFALGGAVADMTRLAEKLGDYPADIVVGSAPLIAWPAWRAAIATVVPQPAVIMLVPGSELAASRKCAVEMDFSVLDVATPSETLAAAIRAAALGLRVTSAAAAHRRVPADPPGAAAPSGLTTREREVLGLLADGLSNKQISRKLGISANTTKFHVSGILDKLSAGTRAEAVAIALRGGVLSQ